MFWPIVRWIRLCDDGGNEANEEGLKAEYINKENYPKRNWDTTERAARERQQKNLFVLFVDFKTTEFLLEMLRDHVCLDLFPLCVMVCAFLSLYPPVSVRPQLHFSYASAIRKKGNFSLCSFSLDRLISFWDEFGK